MVSSLSRLTILRRPLSRPIGSSPYLATLSSIRGFSAVFCRNSYFPPTLTILLPTSGWSLQYVSGPDSNHWIVLVRQLSIRLLRSVASSPRYVPCLLVSCALLLPQFTQCHCLI